MFICFFALWVVLNGKWTTEIGVFGLVFASLAYGFTWKYMGYSPKVDFALFMRIPSAVRYGVNLVVEIIKANLVVCKMILKPDFVPEPQLVQFDVDIKKNRHLVALANSITLTPGTITVDVQDDLFLIHCLDESFDVGTEGFEMEDRIMAIEGGHTPAAPAVTEAAPEPIHTEETEAAKDE